MSRLFFNVAQVRDTWEVRPANAQPGDLPAPFKTEPEAVAFAMHLARAVWRGTRTLTGVCVQVDEGDWREVLRCGEVEEHC